MFKFLLCFLRAKCLQPHREVEEILHKLLDLRSRVALTSAHHHQDPLTAIVAFFNATSIWHDTLDQLIMLIDNLKKANYGQYTNLIYHLSCLVTLIKETGRGNGVNRSQKYEPVNEEHVFLGGTFGMRTFSVQHWRTCKHTPKGCWRGPDGEKLNAYDVVCTQASLYVEYNVNMLYSTIKSLAEALQEIRGPHAKLAQTR